MAPDSSLLLFLRRFAIAFVVVAVITTGVVAAANVIENNKFSSIDRIKLPDNTLAPVTPGAPANYLTHLQASGNWVSQAIHADPASMIPAFTSSWLNLFISARSCFLGIAPLSDSLLALTNTMNRIRSSLIDRSCRFRSWR